MKGKHGQAASARREWSEIERERDEAAHRARQAEGRRAEERDRWAKQREAMEREIAMLRTAAEDAVAPVVTELRTKLEYLRRQNSALEEQLGLWADKCARFEIRLTRAIADELDVAGIVANAFVRGGYAAADETAESDDRDCVPASLDEVREKVVAQGHVVGDLLASGRMSRGGAFAKWREDAVKADYREEARRRISEARACADPIELGPLTQDVAFAAAGDEAA